MKLSFCKSWEEIAQMAFFKNTQKLGFNGILNTNVPTKNYRNMITII